MGEGGEGQREQRKLGGSRGIQAIELEIWGILQGSAGPVLVKKLLIVLSIADKSYKTVTIAPVHKSRTQGVMKPRSSSSF